MQYSEATQPQAYPKVSAEETRNWQEVLAGTLIAAAGLYIVARGLEPRAERHALSLPTQGDPTSHGIQVRESISVNRPADELYAYWRELANLPEVMSHLKSVETQGHGRSHWIAKGPMNSEVAWDAEITYDNTGRSIAWKSVPGSQLPNEGSVYFESEPHGLSTVVHVQLTYHPPLGAVGGAVAKLFGEEPSQQIRGDLRRFKERMETAQTTGA